PASSVPWFRLMAFVAMGLLLSACSSIRYYAQAVHGQGELIVHRRAIGKLLKDPHTDPGLAARLRLALQARRFASTHLGLPDNRSYTGYVQLDRPYVVWNVFAAPPYSVQAVPQCFPIAGCVAYRGWFGEPAAKADAARLEALGDDVWIGGVPAHQLIYVKSDTAFNESFASFVQRQGLREWRASRGLPAPDGDQQAMEDGFTALVLDLRGRLKTL